MSKAEDKKQREIANALLTDKFTQELGQKAIVEHHDLTGEEKEYVARLREVLSDMALDLQRVKIISPGMEYLGSFSVHVFASEVLRAFEFAPITNPHKCTHPVADAALRKLNQEVTKYFGKRPQKLRSGF